MCFEESSIIPSIYIGFRSLIQSFFLDTIASLQEGYGAKMSQMLSEHLDIIQQHKGHRCFLETEIVYNRKDRSQMLYENMGAQWKG